MPIVTGDECKRSPMDLFLGVTGLIRHIMTKCNQLRITLIFRSTLFVHLLKER